MATIPDDICRPVLQLFEGPPPLLNLFEEALATFVNGEFVYIDGSSYIAEIVTDTPPAIYGVAAEPAHNDAVAATHQVAVFLAVPSVLFELNMKQSGLADHVIVQGDLGHTMGVQHDTTNKKWFLNASTVGGANVRMFVHSLARGSNLGDTNARVLASFAQNWVQFAVTS